MMSLKRTKKKTFRNFSFTCKFHLGMWRMTNYFFCHKSNSRKQKKRITSFIELLMWFFMADGFWFSVSTNNLLLLQYIRKELIVHTTEMVCSTGCCLLFHAWNEQKVIFVLCFFVFTNRKFKFFYFCHSLSSSSDTCFRKRNFHYIHRFTAISSSVTGDLST